MINFPIHVLPEKIQYVINQLYKTLGFPKDYTASSMLQVTSACIGNSLNFQVKPGHVESANLFCAIVGPTGSMKSPPMAFVYKPLVDLDSEKSQLYNTKYDEYLTKGKKTEKPIISKTVVNDFTIEALIEIHEANPRGLSIFVDELESFFGNMGRYNGGKEEANWLSIYSCSHLSNDRKGSKSLTLNKPFITILGSIQPKILVKNMSGKNSDNGMLHRFLYAFPNKIEQQFYTSEILPEDVEKIWKNIVHDILAIEQLFDEKGTVMPKLLVPSEEAFLRVKNFFNMNIDQMYSETNDTLKAIYPKINTNFIRIVLILHVLEYVCHYTDNTDNTANEIIVAFKEKEIQSNTVNAAIEIMEYFIHTALKVTSLVSNPVNDLPLNLKKVYEELPNTFTSVEGSQICSELGVTERNFYRLMKNVDLFQKLKHGVYKKCA